MLRDNIIKTKSYEFALESVKTCKRLRKKGEFILSRQLLRSATSIGANVEEGIQGQSKADFIHKLSIAQKEAFESNYWLRLLKDCNYLTPEEAEVLLRQCTQVQKILTAILKTSKGK